MTPTLRTTWLALLVVTLTTLGCGEATTDPASTGGASGSPTDAPAPSFPEPPKPASAPTSSEPAKTTETTPAVTPKSLDAIASSEEKATEGGIKLEPVKFDEFLARMAANKKGKYTLVDVWATWCVPCKENFPHVVEMNEKYGSKGLTVASLSFDDPTNPKHLAEAKKFLTEKKAVFTNYLLDEEQGIGNEKLNISAIPAVFIYGPDGKEVKRFTNDDPNHLFTYNDVEKAVVALLDGKPLPEEKGDKPAAK